MQNLNSYFIDHGLFDEKTLLEHCERHMVRLRMSRMLPHIGVLHYRDDLVFGKGEWTGFARSCRGVIIDFQNKKILAQGFSKFWNVGEPEAPSLKELEARKGFVACEKLDGSMGLSLYDEVTDKFYVSTKGDFDSEQGAWATPRLPESVKDKGLLRKYTLMWEIISTEYQIVIPYAKKEGYPEGLYLIGVRENTSEKLFQPDEVHAFAKQYGLNTFKTYEFSSIQNILDKAKTMPYLEEGFVIRFKGEDLMVKVKSAEYLRVHRFLGNLSDKNLLDVLIAGGEQQIEENLFLVPEEYRQDVVNTIATYKKDALMFRNTCYELFAKAPKQDRKTFAQYVMANVKGEHKPFMFQMFDNKDPQVTAIYQVFRKR